MAAKKSKQNPHQWSNGSWHSRPEKKKTVTLKAAPPGSYPSSFDMQHETTKRGLEDLIGPRGDLTWQKTYDASDYNLGLGQLEEDYGTNKAAIERSNTRTLEDLLSQQQGVERSYQRLGGQQSQTGRAAGLSAGGFAAQAAQKRAVNQDLDLAPINVARSRAGEDLTTSLNDLMRQRDRGVGELGIGFERGQRATGFAGERAQREYDVEGRNLAQLKMESYLSQPGARRKIKVGPKKYKRFKRLGVI